MAGSPNGTQRSNTLDKIKAQVPNLSVYLGFRYESEWRESIPRCQLGKSFKIMRAELEKRRPGQVWVERR